MENITINRLAGIFERLAAIEDRYSVGKLSDDILFAVTQLIGLASEDPPNIDEILATINYVKSDPNYKYLLLDKLDLLVRNTANDLLNSAPPRFDQMPDIYKTFSNEKLDILLSTDFEQLKRKLIDLSAKERALAAKERALGEDDSAGRARLNEYKEYIKDLMSDKGRAKFYKDEIKFMIKMNNSIDSIKNLINDIFAKANSTVQSFEQPRPATQQQQKSTTPKKRSPSTTTKVYDEDEDEDIVESVKEVGPQVRRERDEEGDEVVILPSEPEETESDVVKVIKAIENVQENIDSGLDVEFEFDNYENIKNTLLESLVNVGILSYDPAIDSGKTKKETLAEFIGLLKQYRDVAKRSLNDVLSMINTRNITKRREALPAPKPSTPEQFQRQLDKRNLIRRRDTEQVSQVQAPSELLKLGAMLENHLANVGKFIAELEKLYFALSGEKKLKAV